MKSLKIPFISLLLLTLLSTAQVTPFVNSGNPNFPFPQFKNYVGGTITLADKNPVGMPHAELEQRIKDAYTNICNNMTYNVTQNGTDAPLTVNGVKYIMPNVKLNINHCSCVEADGYYLLAAAYMGDKNTFDGYFMWMHDRQFQKTKRFVDNITNSPNYAYSPGISGAGNFGNSTNVYGGALDANSAADGDVDVALALMMAWKQWGDNGLICTDPELGPVLYKDEAIKYIRTMADTLKFAPSLPNKKYVSGIIGLDGYMKGGDSWAEETDWANTGAYKGLVPTSPGPISNYVDYHAPAYFHAFSKAMDGVSPFCSEQYKRAEASCDWVMGQAYAKGYIPYIGKYAVNGSAVTFSKFNSSGEDFRYGWRTILNHLWNGAPTNTWNPTTHQYEQKTNTYQKDMALRFAKFLQNPESEPYNNSCFTTNSGVSFGGPSNLKMSYDMDGTNGGQFTLNHILGPASPSAVISGNWDLMAQLFRQCVMQWDDSQGSTQRNTTGQPLYFQEWFRHLGMLVLTGNFHDPSQITPQANLKVYKNVDKTFAFYGDTLTYSISYRNYGKPDASNAVVYDTLPQGISLVSGSSSKAVTINGNILTWNIGTIKGTNAGAVSSTIDSVVFKIRINNTTAIGLLKSSAKITCSNGTGWVSNEYPNVISTTMRRNYVDVLGYDFNRKKQASKINAIVGDTITYTIVLKNNVKNLLNGGRTGVTIAGAHNGLSAGKSTMNMKYKIYHGAHEPLINYQNYRISYFVKNIPLPTWVMTTSLNEGTNNGTTAFNFNSITEGSTYNQQLSFTFPNVVASYSPLLYERNGLATYIHEGVMQPHRFIGMINTSTYASINYNDDWSAEAITADDNTPYFPVDNDYTDPLKPNHTVTKLVPNQCGTVTTTIKKQLVEEWDGYTWRRIYGDAPTPLFILKNRNHKDTLAQNHSFVGFVNGYPSGTITNKTIVWPTITSLGQGDSIVYKYKIKVDQVLSTNDEQKLSNIEIYPNPSQGSFHVENSEPFVFQLFNINGQLVEEGYSQKNTTIVGTSLKSGIYILNVKSGNTTKHFKLEKQ